MCLATIEADVPDLRRAATAREKIDATTIRRPAPGGVARRMLCETTGDGSLFIQVEQPKIDFAAVGFDIGFTQSEHHVFAIG